MHIHFVSNKAGVLFHARLDEEHKDSKLGTRIQGDKTGIELLNDKIFFKVFPQDTNSDHIAVAALAIFLPFIGEKVKFNFAVTEAIQDFLKSNYVVNWVGHEIKIESKVLPRLSDIPIARSFSDVAIAIGGGFDAIALAIMFPECKMYHIVDTPVINNVTYYPNYRFLNTAQKISEKIGQFILRVETNLESSFSPRGIPAWFSFLVPALLMSSDWNLKGIMTGTIFESSYLGDGKKYDDLSKSFLNNPIIKVLKEVGLPHYSGLSGVSEYSTFELVAKSGLADHVSHCIMGGEDDGPCGICRKCHRKYLNYMAAKKLNDSLPISKEFEAMSYDKYNSILYVNNIFRSKPLFFASSYAWLYSVLGSEKFSDQMKEAIGCQPSPVDNTKFFPRSLDVIPSELRDIYSTRLKKYIVDMSPAEIKHVEGWKCYGI